MRNVVKHQLEFSVSVEGVKYSWGNTTNKEGRRFGQRKYSSPFIQRKLNAIQDWYSSCVEFSEKLPNSKYNLEAISTCFTVEKGEKFYQRKHKKYIEQVGGNRSVQYSLGIFLLHTSKNIWRLFSTGVFYSIYFILLFSLVWLCFYFNTRFTFDWIHR